MNKRVCIGVREDDPAYRRIVLWGLLLTCGVCMSLSKAFASISNGFEHTHTHGDDDDDKDEMKQPLPCANLVMMICNV